jgi:hypothetical protein
MATAPEPLPPEPEEPPPPQWIVDKANTAATGTHRRMVKLCRIFMVEAPAGGLRAKYHLV